MPGESDYAYSLLRTEAASLDSIRVRDSDVTLDVGTVLHGLDTDGRLHLLVPLAGGESPLTDERSAGVQLRAVTLATGGGHVSYLDVSCQLPHLNPLFCEVADEMLEEMRRDPSRATHACQVVLDRWRELLERRRSRLLGPEQLLGLLAELLVLEKLARRDTGGALALWTGPQGHRFDFVSGNNGLEVKSSSSREGRTAEIHGDRQLEAIPGGELHLIYMRLEPRAEGGETVPGVISRLIASGVSRLQLLETLEGVGFYLSDRTAYERVGFAVLEELTYPVNEDFPRIIPSSFASGSTPPGVSHIRYRVDLSGPSPAPLDPVAAGEVIDRFISGA